MPQINLSFRNTKELENFVIRVATPVMKRIADQATRDALKEVNAFRRQRDTANPQSSIQTQANTSYTPRT